MLLRSTPFFFSTQDNECGEFLQLSPSARPELTNLNPLHFTFLSLLLDWWHLRGSTRAIYAKPHLLRKWQQLNAVTYWTKRRKTWERAFTKKGRNPFCSLYFKILYVLWSGFKLYERITRQLDLTWLKYNAGMPLFAEKNNPVSIRGCARLLSLLPEALLLPPSRGLRTTLCTLSCTGNGWKDY